MFVSVQTKKKVSLLKIVLHTFLVLVTGGLWLVVLIVRALLK